MTKATTRRWFFIGTALFTLVFIGLTVHTHTTIASRTNEDRLTDAVRRGGASGPNTTVRTATRSLAKGPIMPQT